MAHHGTVQHVANKRTIDFARGFLVFGASPATSLDGEAVCRLRQLPAGSQSKGAFAVGLSFFLGRRGFNFKMPSIYVPAIER